MTSPIPLLISRHEPARANWPPLPFPSIDLGAKPRILLLKLSAIGDCLVASPLARALRERYPEAHLTWLVGDKAALVVRGNPFVDEVLEWRGGFGATLSLMREVRRRRFDAVVDVQGAWKSAPFALASGAKYRAVSSRADGAARRAANLVVPILETPPHALEQYLRVASAFDISADAPRTPHFAVPTEARDWAQTWLQENRIDETRLIALNPGAARAIKQWPPAQFAALGDLLHAQEWEVVLLGGPGDVDLAREIASSMKRAPLVAAGQTTLAQLGALLERAAILVSADTGPMHLASGVGTPIVALFGPTDPRRTGPVGLDRNAQPHTTVVRDLPCRPCFQKPTCQRFECLTELPAHDVFRAVMNGLS